MARESNLRGSRLLQVVALGLGACSGHTDHRGAEGNGVFTEGTRLKAIYQQAEGAPPWFQGWWYDTVLELRCQFKDVGLPDRLVCFPQDNAVASDYDHLDVFADAACTQPLVGPRAMTNVPARYFARELDVSDPCGTTSHLFQIDGSVVDSSTPLFQTSSGSCGMIDGYGYEWHRPGAEIPLESLVSATVQPRMGSGRIVPLAIVGSDGSVEEAAAAWDTQREDTVTATDSKHWLPKHWLPGSGALGTGFSDPACSVRAVVVSACGPPPKAVTTAQLSAPCGGTLTEQVHEVGEGGPAGANLYFDDEHSFLDGSIAHECKLDIASSPSTNARLAIHAVGAELPLSVFAQSKEEFFGSGQLQLMRQGSIDGPPTYAQGFFDRKHERCYAQPGNVTADGVVRCLPEAAPLSPDYFADAACSEPLLASEAPSACAPKPRLALKVTTLVDGSQRTEQVHHFYPVGEPYSGPVYSTRMGACAPSDGLGDATAFAQPVVYSLGAELPPSEFATVTVVNPAEN